MLSKPYRLRKKFQFNYVYKKGTAVPGKYFILLHCPRKNKGINIGFSVSNKLGKAVVRNKIKRRLREAARRNLSRFPAGRNYVFVARATIQGAGYAEIEAALVAAVSKAGGNG